MLKNKNILITGGTGFIGSHLANRLVNDNYVRVVDIKEPEFLKNWSEYLRLDLREYQNCKKAVEDMDIVFNLAANMGGIGFITEVFTDILNDNLRINLNMLKASAEGNIEKYFFSSSACVYPEELQESPDVIPLAEKMAYPANPDTYYGWEKLLSEQLCEAYAIDYGLNVRVARFHAIYGPYGTYKGGREKAPAALCRKAVLASNPGEIVVWGDGKQTRSFCYIEDCLDAIIKLTESDYDLPINIGSDRLVTIDYLVDYIIGLSGKELTKRYDPSKPQGVRGRNADLTIIKKVLNWEPKVSMEEGVMLLYYWLEKELNARMAV